MDYAHLSEAEIYNTKKVASIFLDRFHRYDNDIDRIFTEGCCYWFAVILNKRFPNSRIMYDPVVNHFVTEINGLLFDITGEVTNQYNVVDWETYPDELEKERIIRNCINF